MMNKPAFNDDWDDLDDDLENLASTFEKAPVTPEEAAVAEKKAEASVKAADRLAGKQGYTAPRTPKKKTAFRRSDNLRTGRNEHIGLKGRLTDKERLSAISDDREWVNGQTLQYALDALEEKIKNPADKFWQERNFHGVD